MPACATKQCAYLSAAPVWERVRSDDRPGLPASGAEPRFPSLADMEFCIRLPSYSAKFRYDPEVAFRYRVYAENTSKRTNLLFTNCRRIMKKAEHSIEDHSPLRLRPTTCRSTTE